MDNVARPLRGAKLLIVIGFVIGSLFALKTAYDLLGYIDRFPSWFVPALAVSVIYLVALSSYMAYKVWATESPSVVFSKRTALVLWFLVPLSFVCATSLHGFFPFRLEIFTNPGEISADMAKYPILRINFAIPVAGIVLSSVLAIIYFRGHEITSLALLAILNFLVLIPNDNCENLFNHWWNATIGASPLMYLPCFFVVLFVCCGLLHIHTVFNILSAAGICVWVFLLGLGHMTGLIW